MDLTSGDAASSAPMDTKDSFMRIVIAGSIVAVGLLALYISTYS